MSELIIILLVAGGALVLLGARIWPEAREKLPEHEWTPAKQIASDYIVERDHRRGMAFISGGLILLWCDVVLSLNLSGQTFLQKLQFSGSPFERAWENTSAQRTRCKNLCGDGNCGDVQASALCVGDGCPCDEDPASCPLDCAQTSVVLPECEAHCGDGNCSLFTCIRPGCPCAESYKSCPDDCPAPPEKPNFGDEPQNRYEPIEDDGAD